MQVRPGSGLATMSFVLTASQAQCIRNAVAARRQVNIPVSISSFTGEVIERELATCCARSHFWAGRRDLVTPRCPGAYAAKGWTEP